MDYLYLKNRLGKYYTADITENLELKKYKPYCIALCDNYYIFICYFRFVFSLQ